MELPLLQLTLLLPFLHPSLALLYDKVGFSERRGGSKGEEGETINNEVETGEGKET